MIIKKNYHAQRTGPRLVLIKGLYYYYFFKPLKKQVKSTLTYRTHEIENKPRRQICSKSKSMLEARKDACRTLRLHLLGI